MPIYTDGGSTSLVSTSRTPPIVLTQDLVTQINSAVHQGMYVTVADNGTLLVRRQSQLVTSTSTSTYPWYYTNAVTTATSTTGIFTNIRQTTVTSGTSSTWGLLDVEFNSWYNAGQPDTGFWNTAGLSSILKEARGPAIKKSTKNSIKRALKLMSGMGFEEEARIFLKGDTIEVAHPESLLKFVIKKYRNSLILRTERPGYSTPYELGLYTKSDVHVADLCVYMENTPMLDQVLGVAMFIKSGSEEMILKKANWRNLNKDNELKEILALEYPYLESKLRLNSTSYAHANISRFTS